MAVTYLRLFDPTQQFQLKNGAINVAGLLKIKYEGTDDYAPVFDEDGTQLAQPVILDNNGRSRGLFVDASRVYWLEVDDRDGYELFTVRKMTPCGGGGGSTLGGKYDVVSSDGTVSVERYDDGGVTVFDLSTAVTNQAATWGATFATANAVSGDDNWEILPVATSAGTSRWNNGWTASKDCVADIAATMEMTGDSSAISTVDVMCVFTVDGTGVSTEYSQLDPSDSRSKVSFEYKGELLEGQVVDCRIFVKSVEAMEPALVAKAYFNEECDGIVGGGAGGDYHAGDFVEITEDRVINVTGVQPQSAMTGYVQQSAFSSMSSVVSSIQGDTAYISSVVSGITGATGNYVEKSSISAQSAIWNEASGISSKADQSSLTGKLDNSASSLWYPFDGNPSGFLTEHQELSGYVEKSAISAQSAQWNEVSGISGKLDNSASSTWYPMAGNPSGFLTEHQSLSAYVEKSAISAQSAQWNEVSAKLDESAFTAYTATATQFTGLDHDSTLTGDGTSAQPLGVNGRELVFDSSMSTSVSGNSAIVGVNSAIMSGYLPESASGAFQPSGNYVSADEMSAYVGKSSISAESASWNEVSAKLDSSASSSFYTVDNPSGFITGVDLTDYATTGYVDSSVSGKLDSTASAMFQPSGDYQTAGDYYSASNPSGFITGVDLSDYATTGYVESSVSGKLDMTAFNSGDFYSTSNPSGFITGVDLSEYATTAYVDSSVSGKADTSSLTAYQPVGDYYSASNPSGFITGVDLTPYQEKSAMTGYIPTSESGNYQQVTAMTAYQPSGDYIYASALGTGVI